MNPKQLPFLIEVDDYHEFKRVEEILRWLFVDVRISEVQFSDKLDFYFPRYIGVVYVRGYKPTKKALLAMAKKQYGEIPE